MYWCLGHGRDVGCPGVGDRLLPEEIRDRGGLCPEVFQECGIKVQHTVKMESFLFFRPVLRKNKVRKHISPLAHSVSGKSARIPKTPVLHQQSEAGRVRWNLLRGGMLVGPAWPVAQRSPRLPHGHLSSPWLDMVHPAWALAGAAAPGSSPSVLSAAVGGTDLPSVQMRARCLK